MLLIVIYLGAVALTTWALLDVAQTPAGVDPAGCSKGAWALLAVVPFVGPAAWFLLGTGVGAPGAAPAADRSRGPTTRGVPAARPGRRPGLRATAPRA